MIKVGKSGLRGPPGRRRLARVGFKQTGTPVRKFIHSFVRSDERMNGWMNLVEFCELQWIVLGFPLIFVREFIHRPSFVRMNEWMDEIHPSSIVRLDEWAMNKIHSSLVIRSNDGRWMNFIWFLQFSHDSGQRKTKVFYWFPWIPLVFMGSMVWFPI